MGILDLQYDDNVNLIFLETFPVEIFVCFLKETIRPRESLIKNFYRGHKD